MVLGILPVPGHPTKFAVGQGPTALAVDADGICLDIFIALISPSLGDAGPRSAIGRASDS